MNIRVDESKNIEFDVSISGTAIEDLTGYLRFAKNDIEYGVPITVSEGTLKVDLPKLESFIKGELMEGEKIKARLDIIANEDTYIVPWEDTFVIEKPLTVEAKIKNIKEKVEKPKISISSVLVEKKKKSISNVVEEEHIRPKRTVTSKFGKTLVE